LDGLRGPPFGALLPSRLPRPITATSGNGSGPFHMRKWLVLAILAAVAGCATPSAHTQMTAAPVNVEIIAFNDFHGALEPPHLAVPAPGPNGATLRVPAGGAAYLASAIAALRASNPNHIVVAAGDLISASPLASAQFLDEPTIVAMNMIELDLSSVGNHEFDRGRAELLRMQNGGCAQNTSRQPCRLDRFPGARFRYLAANVFPAYAIRSFGSGARTVRIGFIGLVLEEAATLVTPTGIAGLTFTDEAETINALLPRLRAEGAEAIVVLIHQGVSTTVGYNDHSCAGMDGGLMDVLARLDPSVDLIVSGHTHNAYICDYGRIDPSRRFLVTSAGKSGTLLTDIGLSIDPALGRVVARRADNRIVASPGYADASGPVTPSALYPVQAEDPAVAALVARYASAAAPVAARVVGRLGGPATRDLDDNGESPLGDLVADAALAATASPGAGGARIAFSNSTSLRADVIPAADGAVTFGQLFAAQPFGNNLTVKTFTGRQLRALLEQQFNSGLNTPAHPSMLAPSRSFHFSYDLSRPAGSRIVAMSLDGVPIADEASYRVAMNSYLAAGGDSLTVFREGIDALGGPQDIDAFEAFVAASNGRPLPPSDRVVRIDRR
jgi:5'-nucleotidase